ncbi:MAG: class I SAM-dependent methyltransferase [Spirochaetes bacterium]|nr:class I SAM-dependent methyltransferase [Spirochaetota bacterium]
MAIRELLPPSGEGIEIGVGSGRFAEPLGIRIGVDPSEKMREIARSRGIEAMDGVAENLPLRDSQFHFILMVTAICFFNDINASFTEAFRILRPGGSLIIGYIDKHSPIGEAYQRNKNKSVFYSTATFYSTEELIRHLKKAGFGQFSFRQTIFNGGSKIESPQPIKEGYGQGSFVVVRGIK